MYSRSKDAKCHSKMLVKNMYAWESYSAFFVKTGAVFVIHRLSGVMNRASICHIRRICCSWETWQAALGCKELVCYSNMGSSRRAFTQDSSEDPLSGRKSQAQPSLQEVLSWHGAAVCSRRTRPGAVLTIPPHKGSLWAYRGLRAPWLYFI